MATKVSFFNQNIVIYRELSSTLGLGLLLSVFCISFGFGFIKLMPEDLFPRIFGVVFVAAGILLLVGLPKYYAKMKNKVGDVIFEADANGISESTPFDYCKNEYSWDSIEKITLASKYVEKGLDSDGTSYSWNIMLIYFNKNNDKINLIQRSQKQISISPEGNDFITIQFPKNSSNDIKEKLLILSKNKIKIVVCKRIELNYNKNIETCTP